MDIERIIETFNRPERLPVEAIKACLAKRDEVAPAFVSLLERCADSALLDPEDEEALFFIVHILGEMGEQRAFQPLMDFLAADQEGVERILGDAVTETLPRILIATFDGDTDRLYELMNEPEIDEFVRGAVFEAWTYYVLVGRIERDEAHRYLTGCFETLRPSRDSYVWISWMDAIAHLGFAELGELVKLAIQEGRIDEGAMAFRDFQDCLAAALDASDREAWMEQERLYPFQDTIGVLSKWHCFSEQYLRDRRREQSAALAPETVINPFKLVGRNDPCPCGSGKKFKKCCLQ